MAVAQQMAHRGQIIRLQLHGIGDNDNLQGECWDMDWRYDWTMVVRAIEENSQRY